MNSDSPPAAPQAASSKPPSHTPQGFDTPHPGGLSRKAGRSPSDRPFVFGVTLATAPASRGSPPQPDRRRCRIVSRYTKMPISRETIQENQIVESSRYAFLQLTSESPPP